MRKIINRALVLAVFLSLIWGGSVVLAGQPTEEVRGVVDEVIRMLRDPALKSPAQKQERHQRIKQLIDRRFDYEEMARRCLGSTWGRLNRTQQREFVGLFGELLEASYADKIEKYSDEKVDVDHGLVARVLGMNVRRIVVAPLHADHDDVEAAYLRHPHPSRGSAIRWSVLISGASILCTRPPGQRISRPVTAAT